LDEHEKNSIADSYVANLTTLADSLMQTDYEQASTIWREIIKKDENNSKAYLGLAWIAGKQAQWSMMLEMAQKANSTKPGDPQTFFYIGSAYQQLGQHQEAINYFLKARDMHYNEDASFYKRLAWSYFELHNYETAIDYAYQAFQLDHNSFYKDPLCSYLRKCILWLCREHFDEETYKLLEVPLKIWPDDSLLLAYKAISEMYHKKNYEAGKYYINKAFENPIDSLDLLYEIKGSLWFDCLKKQKEGLELLEKAVSLKRNSLNIIALASRVADTNIERAKQLYDEAIRLEPSNINAICGMAELAYREKKWNRGLELAKKGYGLKKNDSQILFLLAYGYFNVGGFEKSLKFYREAEEVGYTKDVVLLYMSIAYCYQKLGQKRNALNYAEKVLSIEPENYDANSLVADLN